MEALNENRSRQDKLKETIDSLEQGRPVKKPSQNAVIARNPVTVFHAPYFKDVNLYTHPPNDDTLKKQSNGEMDLYLTNPRELNETEKGSLVSAVRVNKRFLILVFMKSYAKNCFDYERTFKNVFAIFIFAPNTENSFL